MTEQETFLCSLEVAYRGRRAGVMPQRDEHLEQRVTSRALQGDDRWLLEVNPG